MKTVYRILWDNGNGACGEFPLEFDTYEAAQAHGDDWANECNERDGIDPDSEDAYSAEVIEVEIDDPEDETVDRCDYEGGSVRAALDGRGRP